MPIPGSASWGDCLRQARLVLRDVDHTEADLVLHTLLSALETAVRMLGKTRARRHAIVIRDYLTVTAIGRKGSN